MNAMERLMWFSYPELPAADHEVVPMILKWQTGQPIGRNHVPQAGIEPATFRLGGGCSIR
jgi:hypothetical protein